MTAPLALVHSEAYSGWVFSSSHPTQGRRFANARARLLSGAGEAGVPVIEVESDLLPDRALIEAVHSPEYVAPVLDDGLSGEWAGTRPDLSAIAHRMVGGTLLAARALTDGQARTAVHFPGAKHHAMRDCSSGFCVFNDLAVTATALLADGPIGRVSVVDVDAHHGDGTEALLGDDPRVQTLSVHDGTIFPGTGHADDPAREVFNEPLPRGSGDEQLLAAIDRFTAEVRRFDPGMLLIAAGADGHRSDPLTSLTYSIDGMSEAVGRLRAAFPEMSFLIGGAGGYRPDDATPEAWARMALAAA